MSRFRFLSIGLLFLGSFFVVPFVWGTSADIIINEIAAYPATSHEWVEIYNKGFDPIDLTGWKLVDSGRSCVLKPSGGSGVLAPGGYGVIAQSSTILKQDYPSLNVPIFGVSTAWSTLVEGGELIQLLDAGSTTIESFTYISAPNASLERKNPNLADFTSANWQQRASGNSIGAINSNVVITSPEENSSAASSSTSPVAPTSTNSGATETVVPSANLWVNLRINEVMPDPVSGGSEWVELYNPSATAVDLSGGTLCDNRATSCVIAQPTSTIAAHGFVVVLILGSKLNNDGDSVILKDPNGTIVDQVVYGGNLLPAVGQTIARNVDGAGNWAVTTVPTPGAVNSIVAPVMSVGSGDSPGQSIGMVGASGASFGIIWFVTSTSPVVISEVLPDPTGDDTQNEFIELYNRTSGTVGLDGWKLWVDGNDFELSGSLAPAEYSAWFRSGTRLELKNTTSSEVRLLNQDDAIEDVVSYPLPPTGLGYSRESSGAWQWAWPTPNSENVISLAAPVRLVWRLTVPRLIPLGDTTWFRAGRTIDPRGGKLNFVWTIDGVSLTGSDVPFRFTSSGQHSITISATSSQGTVDRKQLNVTVTREAMRDVGSVKISEVFPGTNDTSEEFVEISNTDGVPVRLDGWQLITKVGKPFTIPESTTIAPGATLVFYQPVTNLNISTGEDYLRLLGSSGERVDQVVVPKIPVGWSYQLVDGSWRALPALSPGIVLVGWQDIPSAGTKEKQIVKLKKVTTSRVGAKKVLAAPRTIKLSQLEGVRKGTLVRVQGVVVSVPGEFGAQYFAIANGEGGAMIYQNKKLFPDVNLGDEVLVKGVVVEAQGHKRVNIAQAEDVDILSTDNEVPTTEVAIKNLSIKDVGKVVMVHGQITSKKTGLAYLDDGTDELKLVIKTGTHITTKAWKLGAQATVTGVVMKNGNSVEVWPRSQDDVVTELVTGSESGLSSTFVAEAGKPTSDLPVVYQVIIGGLLLTNAGVLWQLYRLKQGSIKSTP